MSATFEAKSEESIPLGDDQKNQLLPDDASDELKEEEKIKEDDSKLPEKTRHPLDTSLKLFPLHTWLYILYIVLAILLPIFGTLLILCGNYTNTGYFSLFAILNYPWPKLKLEDPNATATSLELLQVGAILVFSSNFEYMSKSLQACLLDLWILFLALRPLPRLSHPRLPQAALVHHHHPHDPLSPCLPGPGNLGTARLGEV